MKDVDVLIFIEHVDRELKGATEVKKILNENYNLDVKIFSIEFGLFDAWVAYNPKLICLPYCKSEANLVVQAFKSRNPNTLFINLSYEQILNKTTEAYKAPRDEFAREELYYFAWGSLFEKYLIKYGVRKEKIFVVGKPEIQFLQEMKTQQGEEIKAIISNELKLDRNKKWCFLPLNDGAAFRDEADIKSKIEKGLMIPESLVSHHYCKQQVRDLLGYLYEVHKEGVLDEYEIILRPHPGVEIEAYKEVLKELGIKDFYNLHIIRSYTVKEWLCASDVCVSNWSTVLIDAASIGLNSYIFEAKPLHECLDAEWLRWFESITNIEQMKLVFNTTSEDNNKKKVENANMFFDVSIVPTEAWAKAIYELVGKYEERKKYFPMKSIKKEFKRMVRSKVRECACKTGIGRKFVSAKIQYDYFEPIL